MGMKSAEKQIKELIEEREKMIDEHEKEDSHLDNCMFCNNCFYFNDGILTALKILKEAADEIDKEIIPRKDHHGDHWATGRNAGILKAKRILGMFEYESHPTKVRSKD